MSPLFGAAFLWLIFAILWWSGWRDEAAKDLPNWAVGTFLAIWPLAWLGKVSLTGTVSMNGAWAWTLLSAAILAWRVPAARRWTAVSGGLLIGSIAILAERLAFLPHGFTPAASHWIISGMVGLLAALLFRSASEQVLGISLCLFLNEMVLDLLRASAETMPYLRAEESLEAWWIAVLSARLWSLCVKAAGELTRNWSIKSEGRRGGQRS